MNDETLQAETGLFQENGAPIPLEGVEVHGDIAGRAVKVRIRQRFRNAEALPIESVYKFPLVNDRHNGATDIRRNGASEKG